MNFPCFRGNRVNIQGVSTGKVIRKTALILEGLAFFVFDACYINVCVQFNDFSLTAREKKKPILAPVFKKIHHLESA